MADEVRNLTLPEQAADAQAFFTVNPIPQAARGLQQMLERQRVTVALRERAETDLSDYFGA